MTEWRPHSALGSTGGSPNVERPFTESARERLRRSWPCIRSRSERLDLDSRSRGRGSAGINHCAVEKTDLELIIKESRISVRAQLDLGFELDLERCLALRIVNEGDIRIGEGVRAGPFPGPMGQADRIVRGSEVDGTLKGAAVVCPKKGRAAMVV